MARETEKVIQTRLGERTIQMEKVLYFPRGLIGFENQHEFVLLEMREESPFLMLQSINAPNVGLLVADPYSFTADYELKVAEAEQALLRLKSLRQVAVLVTVTIPTGAPEKTALNLMGPILINYEARIGLQVPQTDPRCPTHLYLHEHNNAE